MNEKLKKLYDSKWNELCTAIKPIIEGDQYKNKPAYPFLLEVGRWVSEDQEDESWYRDADIRVMIFGQETNPNGWKCGDVPEIPKTSAFNPDICPTAVSGEYEDLCRNELEKQGYNGSKSLFNGYRNFMAMLNQKFPEKKIGYLWNNIVKIGKSEGTGYDTQIYNIEQKYFRVIPQEVEILKPHVIIFMTGGYDDKIRDNFGEVKFSPLASFSENEVAKVQLPNSNIQAYRTYHPSARAISNDTREAYYKAIINDIKTN